jgi:hypothetical protein
MPKLYDRREKKLVDVAPGQVSAALDSGQFSFQEGQKVPVNFKGRFMFTTPEAAGQYRDRLTFANEEDVLRQRAEERFGGLGGAALGTAYGAVKGLSLGTIPAAAAALGADEFVRDIELAQPVASAVGEFGSLVVDPFAAAGRALRLGRAAQEVRAGTAAAEAAATKAAPAFAEATYEVERAVPALAAGPAAEAAPLRLGGRVAAAEPEAGAGFAAREAARQPRALPPAGREPIAAPESPLTYQAPPFESQVMTDLRLGRANTADRIAELDQTIQLTLGSRARGARQSVRGLQEERAGLARQLEEYDFQLAKYEAPEAEALAAQAERAAVAGEMREPTTLLTGEVSPAAAEIKLGERAAAEAEQARQRLRMGGGAPEFVGPEPGPLMRLGERPLAEAPRVPGALEAEFTESALPTVLREAEMVAPAAAEAAPGLALPAPGPLANLMAQGGTYGAAEEVRRQQTGESEGGLGAVVGAGLMGAAVPAALTLGGRALMGAGRAARGVVTAPAPGLVAKVKGGAETLEKTHVLRSFDISRDHVTRLNNKFDIPEAGEKGTSVFVNFIKGELNGVRKLKDAFPEDAILASIPEDKALKLSQLTPERKAALANAVERFYGQKYDTIFNDAVKSQMVDNALIEGVLRQVRAADVRGLEGLGLQSVKPELEAMEKFLREGQSHSVGSLKELQSLVGENFRARQGEGGSFTKAQSIMYGGLKRALYDAVERVTPGAVNELRATDMAYEMAKMLSEGAKKVVSKAATTSPIGRDLLAQAGLGVAIGQPLAALGYFIGASSLRYLYNQRGEGIIADLAGRLSTNLVRNPQVAARETVDSIINASRPMLLGASAAKFVDTKPDEYMAMSTAVRELQQTRDDVKRRIMDATATMSPAEQQKAVEYFDNQINVLAQRLPKGIPTGKALSEQEKQYSIFARSVLDPHGYGVQAIVDGGAGGQVAADAIRSLGPQGQQFLTSLADDLQARISESAKLRGDENALAVLRNVKTATRVGVGGGARLRAIHGSAMGQGVAGIGKAASSAFANAAKAFSGTTAAIK